jgi:hypothetical protein
MPNSSPQLSRRTLFAGAGTASAAAVAASLLPGLKSDPAPSVALELPRPARGGGYTLSAHVQQYYKTTRL